jgi:hypothetical protein
MNNTPKVLLVDKDGDGLVDSAGSRLLVTVESDPMLALNRVGLEDFDMVVVDPEVDCLKVTEALLDMLLRLGVPFRILQSGNGNGKAMTASGRFRMRMVPRDGFAASVLQDVARARA